MDAAATPMLKARAPSGCSGGAPGVVGAARLAWSRLLVYLVCMSIQMNVAEAKAKLSELIKRAEAGEEVIIARDGAPAVALRPIAKVSPLGFLLHPDARDAVWEATDAWEPDADAERSLDQTLEGQFGGDGDAAGTS